MEKTFIARSMVVDNIGIKFGMAEIKVDEHTIEYNSAGYTVRTSVEAVKRMIREYNFIGSTAIKKDNRNRTRIRYTYGMHGDNSSAQVTMSLSHMDKTGDDEYMITADADELDKYMRELLKDESNR